MRFESMAWRRRSAALLWPLALSAAALLPAAREAGAQDSSAARSSTDPRVGLGGGWNDAKSAAFNLELVSHRDRPAGWFNQSNMGDFGFVNADLAFSGNYVFQGGYNGFQVWDVSDPSNPTLRASHVCPGGQGDVSVYKKLLFVSVEETRGRIDCGGQGITDTVSTERFRGVRIFDISDIDHPKQLTAVQTCRGSHTHTLVRSPRDPNNLYVYVSGTSVARSGAELAGCSGPTVTEDTASSYFRIEVIRVPLARPQDAKVVSTPRIFANAAGNVAGLWKGGHMGDSTSTQSTAQTNMCHDITVYPELGLAAGACSGNGILLDIKDPAHPKRVGEVSDPNFAYWHSATFTNDGRKVLFTDEWGGGMGAKCRASDNPKWGADAIFSLTASRKMTPAGYYKLPAPQTEAENCVAHNGNIIPVPGRDIMVQAWYQGGVSVFDFTDAAHPKEIAFFDRGPMDSTKLVLGGYWSAYWYNGNIYGSEIGRGLDVFALTPSELLSQNEIDAAKSVHLDLLNPQDQRRIVWPASFSVARAYLDQLKRDNGLASARTDKIASDLDRAEKLSGTARRSTLTVLATQLDRDARTAKDGAKVRLLSTAVRKLTGSD